MKTTKGFTLIELLVVIAIIALLLAIIVPSLNTAKQMAGAAVCGSNARQIVMAWITYAEDNDALLCSPYTLTYDPVNDDYDWVEARVSKVTVEDEIFGTDPGAATGDQGIVGGALYPYYENPEAVHCPSDKRSNKPATDGSSKEGGYRTYSFVEHVGRQNNGSEYCHKISDIPSPGAKYVTVEENDCRGLNRGSWIMDRDDPSQPGLVDSFGIYHNMRSILAFADGHAEKIVWKDDRTEEYSQDWFDGTVRQKNGGYHTTTAQETGNQDLAWLYSHYPTKR